MRRSRIAVLSLVLAGVGAGCATTRTGPPPPTLYPLPAGYPAIGTPIKLVIVVSGTSGNYQVTTYPHYQLVDPMADLSWIVVNMCTTCSAPVAVKIDPQVVKIDSSGLHGTATGKPGRSYKYSITIGGSVVEDPEIEIWP
jgi:hypothetical protein